MVQKRKNTEKKNGSELVFLPLGGVGEIGMNLYLYGYGASSSRRWLMVDLGITFPGDREPGVDVILPDTRFIEEERGSLSGILLTHAHEDHFGAVIDLWPRIEVPLYATPFTATLLKAKMRESGVEGQIPINEVALGSRFTIGPFDLELVDMAHSIPEPNGVVIKTDLGVVFHTGDWKLDRDPRVGPPVDEVKIRALGEQGLDALVCDSTNALSDGISPSEADVAETLAKEIASAPHRVAVTTFASNVARIQAVCEAAKAADRHIVVVGRAMNRVIQAAQDTGYLSNDLEILNDDDFGHLPRDKVVALCTGSQGESRAALARIALDEHPKVAFAKGDLVIFSSRTIPGNEKSVTRVQNGLAELGVDIITDKDALVHVSGHPRRGELEQIYKWTKPNAAVPMHGEARHLKAHAELARSLGVKHVVEARNGTVCRLLPGPAEIIDDAPTGRLFRDGRLIIPAEDQSIRIRRKLGYVGLISISIVLNNKGDVVTEPLISLSGVPEKDEDGMPMEESIHDAVMGVLESIPRPRRKDHALVGEAVRKGARAAVAEVWGKKPICSVLVSVV